MTAAARDMLADDAARDSARRLKQIFAAVNGPAAAAQAVLETAAAQVPGTATRSSPRRTSIVACGPHTGIIGVADGVTFSDVTGPA